MSDHDQISLFLEGPTSRGGNVRLADLVLELQTLSSLLVNLDKSLSPTGKPTTSFEVVKLQRASPARIDIAAFPKENAPDIRPQIFGSMFETLRALSEYTGDDGTYYDSDILESLLSMSAPLGKRLTLLELSSNGYRATLTPIIRERITNLLMPQTFAFGTIRGKLEAINLHAGANTCKIYPRIGPAKVAGSFRSELIPEVSAALGKMVEVYGQLQYRSNQAYANHIDIRKLEILPAPDTLPALHSLRGMASSLRGDLTSEEWLERRRREIEPELIALLGK